MTATQSGPATLSHETRSPGAVRANRFLIGLIGLILLLAGLATLGISLGIYDQAAQDEPVINSTADGWLQEHSWIWWAIAGAGVLIALVCLWWLLAQAASNRVSNLRVEDRTEGGRTSVDASALTDALEGEIESYRGVERAKAHLSGSASAPRLSLNVSLDGRVDVAEVHQRITTDALPHARQALSADSLPTRLELSLPRSSSRDVR